MEQFQVATSCTKQLWSKKLATTTFCGVFWTFGLCIGFLGPTLLDLDCQVGESRLGHSTWLFFAQTALMLVGSLMVGFYLTVMTIEMLLLQAVVCAMITLFIIPFCGTIMSLAIVLAIMGYQLGLIDAGGNIAMMQLHHNNVQPFLQAMHFFYGLGAFVSPMISAPFLRKGECNMAESETGANHTFFMIPFLNSTNKQWTEATQLHWAFWIMGASQIPIILILAGLMLTKGRRGKKAVDYETLSDDEQKPSDPDHVIATDRIMSHEPPFKCFSQYKQNELMFLMMTGVMLFLADGAQGGYADYVFSYGKSTVLGLSSADAAHLNATFWGLFTLGRLFAVFLAIWFSPWRILLIDTVGCGGSLALLMVASGNRTVLFVCSAGVGFFLASMAPAGLSLVEECVGVTPSATTVMVVIAASGEIMFPLVTGNLLQLGTYTFPFCLITAVFLILVAYMTCVFLYRTINVKKEEP